MKITRYFSFFAILTLTFFYLVVIAGGIVRTTGSGMGCPDWPKCFGKWIPPSSIDELPSDYKDVYSNKRQKKIQKFSLLLEKIGFVKASNQLRNDPTLLEEKDFSLVHTWTEYANRLVGFLSGNFMLVTFVLSLFLIKYDKVLTILSFINLVILVFQAWFGSIVVATNLMPWIITVHMLLALVLIGIQIKIIHRVRSYNLRPHLLGMSLNQGLLLIVIILSLTQVVFGTQVRQEIDVISAEFNDMQRDLWINKLSSIFLIHRSFSIIVLGLNGWLIYRFIKGGLMRNRSLALAAFLGLEILSGIILSYLDVPKYAQPIHLVMATLIFGLQVSMLWEIIGVKKANLPNAMY